MGTMASLLDLVKTGAILALVLVVLVAVHELGHFWVARAFGMHVDAFAVMMGGVRKTPLEGHLNKPLAHKGWVWGFAALAHVVLLIGIETNTVPVGLIGLGLVGVALPLWVVTRLGALYHIPASSSIGTLAKSWFVAIVLAFFGGRGQMPPAMQLAGLIAMASAVGTLIVYYLPVMRRAEDAPQGHGQIEIDEKLKSTEPGSKESDEFDGDYATRKRKIEVLFRPLAWVTDKRGTEYSLLCLPLGGFAAIRGYHPKEDGSETKIEGGFYSKSPFARLCVLFAGPLFSMLFGIAVLTAHFTFEGKAVPSNEPVLGLMKKDSVAAEAGFKTGDRILEINGKPVATFFDIVKAVRVSHEPGDKGEVAVPLRIKAQRGTGVFEAKVTPKIDPQPTDVIDASFKPTGDKAIQAKLNISPEFVRIPMTLPVAFAEAVRQPFDMVAELAKTFQKPATIADNIGGPASIATTVSQASEQGPTAVLIVAGLLSISLGVFNLLPIVPLDGGQMVVAFAEMLRGGRRLSLGVQNAITTVGAFLVMALILGAVTLDIGRFAPK